VTHLEMADWAFIVGILLAGFRVETDMGASLHDEHFPNGMGSMRGLNKAISGPAMTPRSSC
jgi:hypothetical protein